MNLVAPLIMIIQLQKIMTYAWEQTWAEAVFVYNREGRRVCCIVHQSGIYSCLSWMPQPILKIKITFACAISMFQLLSFLLKKKKDTYKLDCLRVSKLTANMDFWMNYPLKNPPACTNILVFHEMYNNSTFFIYLFIFKFPVFLWSI